MKEGDRIRHTRTGEILRFVSYRGIGCKKRPGALCLKPGESGPARRRLVLLENIRKIKTLAERKMIGAKK